MIKLDLTPTSLTYATNLQVDLETHPCLIVLIPTGIDYSAATRRIRELAHTANMHVSLLGLCKDSTEEPNLRRELVTMASLLQDGKIWAEANIEIGTNWIDAVKTCYQTGDVLVCFAEKPAGRLRRPLSQILESNFKATVYVLSDLTLPTSRSTIFSQLVAWLGFIGIILGFGILQTRIVSLPEGGLQSILLILSIIPEFWLIWTWGVWFG